MTNLISLSQRQSGQGPVIRPVGIDDVPSMRLGWSSRLDKDDLLKALRRDPGLTLWIPETGEFVAGGRWRHRREIATILELSGSAHAIDLVEALVEQARRRDRRLVIVSERYEQRKESFYQSAGFELIEEILIYELSRIPSRRVDYGDLTMVPVDVSDRGQLDELIRVDHAAFPWLWWNSVDEFNDYAGSPGVEIYLGWIGSQAVSYIGITRFRSWGHLDRIAVVPDLQGEGIGLRSLDWAVAALAANGARRVGLSTQQRNTASRRLYERYGFRRSASHDYYLYGQWLAEPPEG